MRIAKKQIAKYFTVKYQQCFYNTLNILICIFVSVFSKVY